ncbi:NAD(P)/FAD-dependent oxidoreductase [Paracoccus sp. Z118]|uniref:FAD/NAD(P)-dependent oxidoreductase n=1 Tax=Paracoccus sp. Z118 TaxID=2851017 RepID=UPI001C2C61B7|nr:FAD/NAD(P)-binding oxidoreductase [Paracoccus sp. Z118]MBV0891909.1 NAD(P)/FAD-dependent oxidoreductase [Paracoccus sp. Z118]
MSELHPVVIGAGPAGLACAKALLEAGLRPVVLEENPRPGGQGTRRLSPLMTPEAERLFGHAQAGATARREAEEDRVLAACDWRPGSLVWGIFDNRLAILRDGRHDSLPYDRLLIATGATDRIMAFPGWTLPGVFSLGAAQVALKQHAAFIGSRVVLAGASPLLYLAAAQYLRMGVRHLTIVDAASRAQKRRAAAGMAMTGLSTLIEGLRLLRELRRPDVRRIDGADLVRAIGGERLEAVEIRHASGRTETLACDALAFGHGLRPETQLAELAGARFSFHPQLRNWFPIIDADGRAGQRLWLAGDGAMTGGREAAAYSGRLAALSMLADRAGAASPVTREARALRRRARRLRRFQVHSAGAFPWPHEQAAAMPDDTIICRCERVTAGEIRKAVSSTAGPVEINRVKAITRCGMGRCQARFCGPTLQELTAAASGRPVESVGRLRAQAPLRPIPVGSADEEARA